MAYDETKRHRRYKGSGKANDTPLSFFTNQALKTAFKRKTFVECKLMTDWSLIIGKKYASLCYPLKVVFPSQHSSSGILHVVVHNGSAAMQIQYSQPILLERLGSYFGYKAISQLVIHQKSPTKKYDSKRKRMNNVTLSQSQENEAIQSVKCSEIKDTALREALERLAVSVYKKNLNKKQ